MTVIETDVPFKVALLVFKYCNAVYYIIKHADSMK